MGTRLKICNTCAWNGSGRGKQKVKCLLQKKEVTNHWYEYVEKSGIYHTIECDAGWEDEETADPEKVEKLKEEYTES